MWDIVFFSLLGWSKVWPETIEARTSGSCPCHLESEAVVWLWKKRDDGWDDLRWCARVGTWLLGWTRAVRMRVGTWLLGGLRTWRCFGGNYYYYYLLHIRMEPIAQNNRIARSLRNRPLKAHRCWPWLARIWRHVEWWTCRIVGNGIRSRLRSRMPLDVDFAKLRCHALIDRRCFPC